MSGVAPDGSPVDVYLHLPAFGEPELIHDAIPAGADILELGSGTGRMTHPLIALGHRVTAVDNSEEMLAHVRGAETVHAEIDGLELGRRFACVLLASHFINDDDEARASYLATCARHVAPGGAVLIERYDPDWAADPTPSDTKHGDVRIRVLDPRREGRHFTATVEYTVGDRTWLQGPFTATILGDEELASDLEAAGLRLERWLDERRTWLLARPTIGLDA